MKDSNPAAARQAARAFDHLRAAINTARQALDAAARRVEMYADNPDAATRCVLNALAWGQANATSSIETAMGCIEDAHAIRAMETGSDARALEGVQVSKQTIFKLNARGENRWSAQVQPGRTDDDVRVTFEECSEIARALAGMPDMDRVQRDAKRWNDLLELCGHLGDSSETTVTLSQDDACRTQHIKVGDRRFYGTSWGQVLDKAVKGDES